MRKLLDLTGHQNGIGGHTEEEAPRETAQKGESNLTQSAKSSSRNSSLEELSNTFPWWRFTCDNLSGCEVCSSILPGIRVKGVKLSLFTVFDFTAQFARNKSS